MDRFLKSGRIKTPAQFLNGSQRKSAGISDLIIDPAISGQIYVADLIDTDEGNLDGWGFSLDTVSLAFVRNRFEEAAIRGRLSLPVMDTAEYLKYASLLSVSEAEPLEYQFVIQPTDTVNVPMWLAKAHLDESSYVGVHVSADSTYLESFLSGVLRLDVANLVPEAKRDQIAADLDLPGAQFQFKLHSKEGFSDVAFDFTGAGATEEGTGMLEPEDEMYWASTDEYLPYWIETELESDSRQNQLSGFPVSITDVSLSAEAGGVTLAFTPQLSLVGGEEGFAASTTFNLHSELNLLGNGQKKFRFTGIGIECIELDVDIANMVMEGGLCFYREESSDGGYDKGTRGNLNVFVPGVDLGVNLAAEFGTSVKDKGAEFGSEDYYPYWFVDGLFYSGTAGITIPPGVVTIHGLGGGISYNMAKIDPNASLSADAIRASDMVDSLAVTQNPTEAAVERTGVEREKSYGARSLSFTVILGIIRQELMNMDVGFEVAWEKGHGIQSISMLGDGYFLTPINDRNDPQLRADKVVSWSLLGDGETAVDANLDVYMNFEMVKGGHENHKMIDGAYAHWQNYGGANGKGYFDVALGDYTTPGKVIFDTGIEALDLSGTTYLMAGHHVPTSMPPLPTKIQNLLSGGTTEFEDNSFESDPIEDREDRSSEELEAYRSGKGIAHGAQLNGSFTIDATPLYASLEAVLGFDMNISQDENRVCYAGNNNTTTPGLNGWYGTGQVYAGLEGAIGVQFKAFGKPQQVKLMDLGAAVALEGGAPNPSWFDGRATVTYSILGGTLEGSTRFAISVGESCNPNQDGALAEISFIGAVVPEGTDVNPYTDPAASFNLPMDEVLYLPVVDEQGIESIEQYRPYLHAFTIQDESGLELDS